MLRVLVMLLLVVSTLGVVAPGTAHAQQPAPAPASPTAQSSTSRAQEVVYAANRRVAELLALRKQLATQYDGELAAIDRLKQKKKSWNQERELKDKLSAANETALKLQRLDRQLAAEQALLAAARTTLVKAIDSELATRPPGPRADALYRLRAQLVPKGKAASSAHRIAMPSLEVDPNADPEDLDAQAAELRQIEAELQRQITALDKQSKDLERQAELRRSHDRTIALDRREDNTPTRNTPAGDRGSRGFADAETGANDSPAPQGPGETTSVPPPTSDMGFEAEATIVLQDVVDPSTIDTLASAQRSGDPSKRSKAAAKTRDAVKAKLDLLRQKRAQIESRAKQLRK